jgi:hypothetical protein
VQTSWENLRADIAAEFEPFVHRYYEIEDVLERIRAERIQEAKERVAFRLAVGRCANCNDKRAPHSRQLCPKHLASHSKREVLRKRRKGLGCRSCFAA